MDTDHYGRTHWTDYAACRGMSAEQMIETFYPEDSPFPLRQEALVEWVRVVDARLCSPCPVRTACLLSEVAQGSEQYGIRAGTTPEMRRALARTRTRAKCPHCARLHPDVRVGVLAGRSLVHQICPGCGMSWTAEPSLARAS
jgi:hypothetical protein